MNTYFKKSISWLIVTGFWGLIQLWFGIGSNLIFVHDNNHSFEQASWLDSVLLFFSIGLVSSIVSDYYISENRYINSGHINKLLFIFFPMIILSICIFLFMMRYIPELININIVRNIELIIFIIVFFYTLFAKTKLLESESKEKMSDTPKEYKPFLVTFVTFLNRLRNNKKNGLIPLAFFVLLISSFLIYQQIRLEEQPDKFPPPPSSLTTPKVPIDENRSSQDICVTDNTDINNLEFQKEAQVYVNAWVKVDNTPAYYCFTEQQERKIKSRLKIRSHYRIVKGNYNQKYRKNSRREKWSLLVKGSEDRVDPDKVVGWVSDDNLIFNKEPLRNDFTNIYEKVLIREGDMNSEDGTGSALRIFQNPELTMAEDKGIEVGTVFYVYDYYPQEYGDITAPNIKSLLISPVSHLGYYTAPLLLGWIDRKKVAFWNTRMACEFPFGNKVELITDKGKIVFDQNYKRLPYNSLRNPMLEDEGDYYRIGIFARLDPDQLQRRKQLEKITTGLEVLFVIDGTRNMAQSFKNVLDGVEEVADFLESKSSENNLEQPGFGLAFYRDTAIPAVVLFYYKFDFYSPKKTKVRQI